jgi:hypothetical protein
MVGLSQPEGPAITRTNLDRRSQNDLLIPAMPHATGINTPSRQEVFVRQRWAVMKTLSRPERLPSS